MGTSWKCSNGCISEMGSVMWYGELAGFLHDDEQLTGPCVRLWDMYFSALWEEQGSWRSPREWPSGLVRACKHQMLSFIYWRVINSLGNACFSQVTYLLFYACDIFKSVSGNVTREPKEIPAWLVWCRFPERHLGAEDAQVAFYMAISIEKLWFKHYPSLRKKNLPNLEWISAL